MITFKSGLKLVFVQNTAVRSVAIGVFVGAGVVKETPEIAGISHFIEHMVFKGTTKRSAFDIVNEIDSIGAQINAFTAKVTRVFTPYLSTPMPKSARTYYRICISTLLSIPLSSKRNAELSSRK